MSHRILAIDDSSLMLASIAETLAEEFSLRTASCGEEALELAQKFRPELVLLDVEMPGIDGYETCRRLRSISNASTRAARKSIEFVSSLRQVLSSGSNKLKNSSRSNDFRSS